MKQMYITYNNLTDKHICIYYWQTAWRRNESV